MQIRYKLLYYAKTVAYGFIKKLVLAWDSDFTKLTKKEAKQFAEAEKSGFVNEEDIDWNNIDKILE